MMRCQLLATSNLRLGCSFKAFAMIKKAKIILTILGISAVVGGILAFKTNREYNGFFQCTTTTTATSICPLVNYAAVPAGGTILRCKLIGDPANKVCVPIRVTFDL